ncbi:MAG: lysophospholipid acyltransferase family protein [Spirochaetia bacterium]|jgi:lauroyl/myristoyl acyltransferase|nr:lysophospholipid acyltransferase family protein [Spirochaetia bacterium]
MKINLSNFFQVKFNVMLFKVLPYSCSYVYMQLIGRLYYLIFRKEKHTIEKNVQDLLKDKPDAYIRKKTKLAFKGIFDHYFEKMYSAFKSMESISSLVEKRFTIENEHILKNAFSMNKGVILVTAHWGAVEFIPWVMALRGYPISVILECQTEHLAKSLQKKAEHLDANLITSASCESVYGTALGSLQQNRLLMTECDEVDKWRKKNNRTMELFGQKLYFDNTLDIMAQRSGAPVVGVFLRRNGKGKFTLICEMISNGERGETTAARSFELLEKYVYQAPEQWYQWKKWQAMKAVS